MKLETARKCLSARKDALAKVAGNRATAVEKMHRLLDEVAFSGDQIAEQGLLINRLCQQMTLARNEILLLEHLVAALTTVADPLDPLFLW